MANKQSSGDEGRELRQHPLIERLSAGVAEGGARVAGPEGGAPPPPDVTMLAGYPARDTEPEYWRIYEDVNFASYVRVAEADIVAMQTLATDSDPLRASAVWVRRGATVEHTRVETRQVRAAFLQGSFVSELGTVAPTIQGMAGAGYLTVIPQTRIVRLCHSVEPCQSVDFCRTRDYGACFTRPAWCRSEFGICGGGETAACTGAICPTREFVCGVTAGCTVGPECGF